MALGEGLWISVQLFVMEEELRTRFYLHKEPFLVPVCELSSDASSPVPR